MSTISRADNKTKKKKKFRADAKFWTRLIVLLLAVVMVGGTVCYAIEVVLATKASAATVYDTDNVLIRVAVVYGSTVNPDYRAECDTGIEIGYTNDKNEFTSLMKTDITKLSVTLDKNLVHSDDRYLLAKDEAETTVGAYHIAFDDDGSCFDTLKEAYPELQLFKGYYNGKKRVMLGDFYSSEKASDALNAMKEAIKPTEQDIPTEETEETEETEPKQEVEMTPEEEALLALLEKGSVSENTETGVSVIDQQNGKIIFEFDNTKNSTFIALKAIQKGSSYSFIKAYRKSTKYTYDEILECSLYNSDGYYGLKAVNILHLENYICGVIPYEISNAWPIEAMKAFAITSRSYALSNMGKHKKAYNSDFCSADGCQTYKGFGSTNATVKKAVSETKGLVAVSKGNICLSTYSSSTGGCTASSHDVWGSVQSAYPYLVAVATPWELYETHGNGSWTSSATGEQIYKTLVSKGYTALKSAVSDIEIVSLGTNSSYVTEIKFTDTGGRTLTVKRGDKVKSALSTYLKSGNFVVAKAGETVERVNFTIPGFNGNDGNIAEGISVRAVPEDAVVLGQNELNIITSTGKKTITPSNSESVISSSGVKDFDADNALNKKSYKTVLGVNGETLPDVLNAKVIVQKEKIKVEGEEGTFVFIGRGWGHGVGLSQWGLHDMAKLGYDYETIYKAYYTGAEIVSYTEFMNRK